MVHKVNYADFDVSKIIFGKVEEKQGPSGPNNQPIKYYTISIQYMYETINPDGSKSSAKGPLYIEGPPQTSRGPQTKEFKNEETGKVKVVHSLFTKYDLGNPQHAAFIDRSDHREHGTIHKLSLACCSYVFKHSKEVNINDCYNEAFMMPKLNYPVKWTLENGVPVNGENPAAIWKLYRFHSKDKAQTYETTFFSGVDGRKLPWALISNSKIEHTPMFKVNDITIAGGKLTIKIDVTSTIVSNILPLGQENAQSDTLAKIKESANISELEQKIRELELANAVLFSKTSTGDVPTTQKEQVSQEIVIPGITSQSITLMPSVAVPAPILSLPLPVPVIETKPIEAVPNLNTIISSGPQISLPTLPSNITISGLPSNITLPGNL